MSFIFIAAAIYEIVNNLIALTVVETSKKKYINFIKPLSIVNFTLLTATVFYIQSLLGSSKNDYAIYLLAAAFIFAIILSFFNLISKRTKAEKTSTNNVFIPGLAITQIALTLLNALGLIIFVVINNPKTGSDFYFLLIIPILLLLFGGLLINNFIKKSSNRKNKPLYIIQIVTISIMVLIMSLLMRNLPLEHQIFNAIILVLQVVHLISNVVAVFYRAQAE